MLFLRETGLDQTIRQAYDNGHTKVVGICGGYQLMGKHIADPECSEGTLTHIDGLGLLPVSTTLTNDKHTCQSAFTINGCSTVLHGYEIHTGITRPVEGCHITLTAVPHSSGIPSILRYRMARSFIQLRNTAQMAPQSCSIGSVGKSLPACFRIFFRQRSGSLRLSVSLRLRSGSLGLSVSPCLAGFTYSASRVLARFSTFFV